MGGAPHLTSPCSDDLCQFDNLVPIEEQISCYEALGEPKKLVKLPDAQHYESYQFCNAEIHKIQKVETLEWYQKYL